MIFSESEYAEFEKVLNLLESIEYPCGFDEYDKAKSAYDILKKLKKRHDDANNYNWTRSRTQNLWRDLANNLNKCCQSKD